MSDNNLFSLSFKLYRANRKKSRFIKVIVFIIFIIILFFIDTLFSTFQNTINKTDFKPPLFIVTKEGSRLDLQKNTPLRKICISNKIKKNLENNLSDAFYIKEGFIFETYFTEIVSERRNNVLVELIDFSTINPKYLKKIYVNTNKKKAFPVYVNNQFCKMFDLKSDYLVYVSDFFGDFTITRMRADSSLVTENSDTGKARCYVDLKTLKPFLSVPEDLSLPLFLYYKDDINIFSPKYLYIKHCLFKKYKNSGITIQPFYSADKATYDIFNFYMHIIIIIVIVVILILIYAMSVSYYINFNTRKRDFALFRSFGLTDKKLFWLMFLENFYTCFSAFVVSVLLNFLTGTFIKEVMIGGYSFGFNLSWPGMISLVIILIATSFISIIKAYRRIIKETDISALMERE